jgi:hypothetical protein
MSIALQLYCHPDTPCPAVRSVSAELTRPDTEQLQLRYRIDGELVTLRVPAAAGVLRAGELWKHTCCELFLAVVKADAYCEYNFSPSGSWAAYQFGGYRADMQELALRDVPRVQCVLSATSLVLTAQLRLDAQYAHVGARMRIGVATVIETVDGALSYWALQHAPGRADFHRAAGHLEMEL